MCGVTMKSSEMKKVSSYFFCLFSQSLCLDMHLNKSGLCDVTKGIETSQIPLPGLLTACPMSLRCFCPTRLNKTMSFSRGLISSFSTGGWKQRAKTFLEGIHRHDGALFVVRKISAGPKLKRNYSFHFYLKSVRHLKFARVTVRLCSSVSGTHLQNASTFRCPSSICCTT